MQAENHKEYDKFRTKQYLALVTDFDKFMQNAVLFENSEKEGK